MTKLFISYAHVDSEIVLNISGQLQEAGYELWVDKFGIQGGDLWVSAIVKGIRDCDIFLLFISSKSVLSDFVRRELDIAFNEKRKIIPVMIENVDTPDGWDYQLAGIQYIDHRSPDWKSRLLTALSGQPARQPITDTGKLKNPYSSLPVLEPIERTLILANREKELRAGFEYLKEHRLLLVTGMPGIGKSTFARALLDLRPDGSLPPFWCNFKHQSNSGNTLGVLLDRLSSYLDICLNVEVRREVMAFRDAPAGQASVNDVDVLISFLNQEKPIWLVFDNLETVLSPETSGFLDERLEILFDSLKNNTQNTKIIITNPFIPIQQNGERFLEAGTQALTLKGLDNASAMAFLQAYGLKDLPANKLASLLQDIDGHPLLLDNIAHYIQAMGVPAAMENLQGGLEEGNEKFGGLIKKSLSSQEFNALQSLTILNRETSLTGLCQIAQVRPSVIMRLREKALLQTNDMGKFWLHNIVRNSLRLTDLEAAKQANLRAMNFYRGQELPLLRQSIDDYASVLEWHYHAVEAGDIVSAYSALYSTGMEDQLMKWNEYDLLDRLCEPILAMAGLKQNNLSNVERVKIHRTFGTVYFYKGDLTKSITYLKIALDILQPEDDKELRITLLIELSESYNGNRDFELAMEVCNQAISSLSVSSSDGLQAKILHLRGIINRDQGKLEQAIDDLARALKFYTRLMDHPHIVNATVDLGIVYYLKNQFAEAVATYRQVIMLCEAIQDMRGVMLAHFNIGDINLQDEQYDLAVTELQTALEIARNKKFAWMEVPAGLNLVEAQIQLLELDNAERELGILSPIIMKQASPCFSGQELALIASLHWRRKQTELAGEYFKRAFRLFESAECQEQMARTYLAYAGFMKEQGYFNQAKEALLEGKNVFIELNNQLGLKAVERAMLDIPNDPEAR